MTKIRDIYNYLNEIAPFDTAMDFDNVGLLIGSYDTEVKKVLITLDITKAVAEECSKINAQLIISHHPVIFNPLRKISTESIQYLLISKGIDAIGFHTNYDIAPMGVNYSLSKALDLKNTTVLEKYGAVVGELLNEMSNEEFANYVLEKLNCKGLRYTASTKNIKKVVVCGGAAGEIIFNAASIGADAFVTGEIKHHEIIFAGENNIMAVDAGHYKTEDVFAYDLIEMLSQKFKDVEFIKSNVFTDKIEYISR